MNIDSVEEIWRPATQDQVIGQWRDGDCWLAGGTWLFSEPQPGTKRLIDLTGFAWKPLVVTDGALEIAATCTIAELYQFETPREWTVGPLIRQCCRSFLASSKIWNAATVGGNFCMSLPAGPMISMAAALDGIGAIIGTNGTKRHIPIVDFVLGDGKNGLRPGELFRSVFIPAAALRKRYAIRQISLTQLGRSTALLIGTLAPESGQFQLTISASTVQPVCLPFDQLPDSKTLHEAIMTTISDGLYFSDPHGSPVYRKHLTFLLAEEIRAELGGPERSGDAVQ